ncbi:hypothetical protein CW751_12790 [Brumimicrobium salinarum]|uniref:Ig-like domain-containing protein n=1 Tax=Brumimicrobium salinarum TaxID=2058658 RepID=A0A2I0QZS4_9FLAO|nr:gliding motility-associated C-terminal domain-containing protein [Brumimicrobium salinarum]PKR79828.1 hypothetical protein CW751_12790 [Brumimicrobium salinarum]
MHKKILLYIVLLIAGLNYAYAQDAAITGILNVGNGCDLSNAEDIGVAVRNDGPLLIDNNVVMNYTINGGATVSQTLGPGNPAATGAVYNFTFAQKADLSACDTDFDVLVWLEFPGDVNQANDTIRWSVRNDCTIIPGQVESDELVCIGNNGNTLNLVGQSNGTITNWVYSEDGGATWTNIPNTSTSYTFSNLTDDTQFAVEIDGGYCPNDVSSPASITIQALPTAGTLSGPTELCDVSANGVVNLNGNSGNVVDWELSTDNGVTWVNSGNTTTTESFSGLTQNTLFRALVDGGACANVYSDTLELSIVEASAPGLLETDTLICEDESLTLSLGSSVGSVQDWESSSDGTTWSPLSITGTTYNTGALSSSTYYRVLVKNGICPIENSNQVYIEVQPNISTGSISGGASVCATSASGVLTLSGNSSTIIEWESSTDSGMTWATIANTTTTENYTNLNQTTWYRVLIDGGVCPDQYSDTALINVSPITDAGVLEQDTLICEGDSLTLNLNSNIGSIIDWESSTDGSNWTSLVNTSDSYMVDSILTPTYYRVIVKSGVCAEDTTNIIFVDLNPDPTANAGLDIDILEGDTIMLNGSGGQIGGWTNGESLSDSLIYDPLAFPTETTTYYLTVMNSFGCTDTDNVTITVGTAIPDLDVKNVLTPNGDGYNDTWIIEGLAAFSSTQVEIYNIYGRMVYQSLDYQNEWDGKFEGKALPNGSYLYVVTPDGYENAIKGTLMILGDE